MMLAINLDERTKKIILVLCILFILVLLIFGLIYTMIKSYMNKESKKMDNYMYDLVKYQIVKKPSQFKKAVRYHESRSFYNNLKWPIRLTILFTGLFILTSYFFFDKKYLEVLLKGLDLIPIFKWPTIKETNESLAMIPGASLIKGPDWMPVSIFPTIISKNPNYNDPRLYVSVIYYILMIFILILLIKATLGYIARYNKGMKKAKAIFNKNLDNFDIGNVIEFNNQSNSNIPNQSDYEIKDK